MGHFQVSDKIRLEKVKLSMAPIIFETIVNDREYLKQWLPFVDYTKQISDTENFIKSVISDTIKPQNTLYSIWYKEEFAGLIGNKDTDWINHKTEFGYWLAQKMQGKGIVTSVLKKLIPYSFQKLKINRIQIKVAIGNFKSEAIPLRLGFKLEGIERSGEFHLNKYLDLKIYSLLKNEWEG